MRAKPDPIAEAVRYLARGDRSAVQVERHLEGRGFAKSAVRQALRTLNRLGYVNDEAVALRMAGEALAAELDGRGFAAEAVARAVSGAYAGLTDEAVAERFLESLPLRYKEPERERRRRAGLLRGRGFSSDVSEAVLGSG